MNNYLTALFLTIFTTQACTEKLHEMEIISFKTQDNAIIEASFFKGSQDFAVVFAHGAIFDKESWYFMAGKLQKEGVSALSLDFRDYGNSTKGTTNKRLFDVLGAIDYLKGKGFQNIGIVGGSMGGAAVLNALAVQTDAVIQKVVLLSPAGGPSIASDSIEKLLIVSKDERLFTRVNTIFNESAQPKALKIYPGTYHAQHMFKADYKEALITLILDFLIQGTK